MILNSETSSSDFSPEPVLLNKLLGGVEIIKEVGITVLSKFKVPTSFNFAILFL